MVEENLEIRYFIFGSMTGIVSWICIDWLAIYIFNH